MLSPWPKNGTVLDAWPGPMRDRVYMALRQEWCMLSPCPKNRTVLNA